MKISESMACHAPRPQASQGAGEFQAMMKENTTPETAQIAENGAGNTRRASRAEGTSDAEILGRNRRGARRERGESTPTEAAKTSVADFMNSPVRPERAESTKSEPKPEVTISEQVQPNQPARTENSRTENREQPAANDAPAPARSAEPTPAPQQNNSGSKMDQFLDLVSNGNTRNELFNKHGDRNHNNGVKAPGIVTWAKDNGLDLSLGEAQNIVRQIDEKANGSFHLDKVELDYFQRTGRRAPDGITQRG